MEDSDTSTYSLIKKEPVDFIHDVIEDVPEALPTKPKTKLRINVAPYTRKSTSAPRSAPAAPRGPAVRKKKRRLIHFKVDEYVLPDTPSDFPTSSDISPEDPGGPDLMDSETEPSPLVIDESSIRTERARQNSTKKPALPVCATCGKRFDSKRYLSKHLALLKAAEFFCSRCHLTFKSRFDLNFHMPCQVTFKISRKPVKCV